MASRAPRTVRARTIEKLFKCGLAVTLWGEIQQLPARVEVAVLTAAEVSLIVRGCLGTDKGQDMGALVGVTRGE
jgi:hypothetical protein